MQKKFKKLLLLMVGALIAGAVFVHWMKPLDVPAMAIRRQILVRNFKESATIRSENRYSLTPAFDGKVLYIAPLGSVVREGDLLLRLDSGDLEKQREELAATRESLSGQEKMNTPTLYQSQLDGADIAVRMAEDEVNRSQEDLMRTEALYKEGALAEVEYDKVRRVHEIALKQLELSRSQRMLLTEQTKEKEGSKEFYDNQRQALTVRMSQLNNQLVDREVYADRAGIVTLVTAQEGDFVNRLQKVMEISSEQDMKIVCEVLSSEAAILSTGQEVTVLRKVGEETLEEKGEIVSIAPYAKTQISSLGLEEQRVEVKIRPKNVKGLILGMNIDVLFETMRAEDVFAVAKSSVFEENGHYLWKIINGKLQKQPVEIGRESDYDYEIISGLQEGDVIVLTPDHSELQEGKRIKPIQNEQD